TCGETPTSCARRSSTSATPTSDGTGREPEAAGSRGRGLVRGGRAGPAPDRDALPRVRLVLLSEGDVRMPQPALREQRPRRRATQPAREGVVVHDERVRAAAAVSRP